MMFHEIAPKTLTENVFSLIGDRWMLITAGTPDHCNTMTASWGGLGVLWRKPMATIYVRPQRYTFGFIEQSDEFTLSFFGPQWKKALSYCGAVSGRDEDKFAACGFHVAAAGQAPYIQEADLVLVCKALLGRSGPRSHGRRGPARIQSQRLSPDVPGRDHPGVGAGLTRTPAEENPSQEKEAANDRS